MPLYAAGGAVVPFDLALPATVDSATRSPRSTVPPASPPPATAAPPAGPRALMIFVPPGYIGYNFVTWIYDDDGESNAYATGGYCVLKVRVTAHAANLEVEVEKAPYQGRGRRPTPSCNSCVAAR